MWVTNAAMNVNVYRTPNNTAAGWDVVANHWPAHFSRTSRFKMAEAEQPTTVQGKATETGSWITHASVTPNVLSLFDMSGMVRSHFEMHFLFVTHAEKTGHNSACKRQEKDQGLKRHFLYSSVTKYLIRIVRPHCMPYACMGGARRDDWET
jgi:hypothetical protein